MTFVDAGIELIICYICYTMGSSAQLRRFDCNIQKNKKGELVVRFRPKERPPSIVSESEFAEYVSDNGGEDLQAHDMDLGACDDIVQQFIRGLEAKLSKSFHERDG